MIVLPSSSERMEPGKVAVKGLLAGILDTVENTREAHNPAARRQKAGFPTVGKISGRFRKTKRGEDKNRQTNPTIPDDFFSIEKHENRFVDMEKEWVKREELRFGAFRANVEACWNGV